MWQSSVETLQSNRVWKIKLYCNDRQLTYSEVIELWQGDADFRSFFNALLAETSFSAYFWETPPITRLTVEREFEFVLIDSPQLAKVKPDARTFSDYFAAAPSQREIVTFPNLGNDALLVVPRPMGENSVYSHLATFVREAPESQQQALWQTLGNVLSEHLGDRPTWVSTSGLGVYWLHIRLDSYPKYYNFDPYRR